MCAALVGARVGKASPGLPPVAADSAGIDSTLRLGVADTVTTLPPVRVDADRPPGTTREAATTVRFERSKLVRFQPSTTADALLSAPGLDVSRTGPWASQVSLRGLGGERVLVLVDGVRLQAGRGHGAQTSLVSVDRLESVELLPGAGGAVYGSDALGGVVELNTHRSLIGRPSSTLMLTGRSASPGEENSALARDTAKLLGRKQIPHRAGQMRESQYFRARIHLSCESIDIVFGSRVRINLVKHAHSEAKSFGFFFPSHKVARMIVRKKENLISRLQVNAARD